MFCWKICNKIQHISNHQTQYISLVYQHPMPPNTPPLVEVVRVACPPARHTRQYVSKMRMSSPWLVCCAAEAICFIPLAVDTFGGWHGAALDVIAKLGRQLARQLGKEEEEVTRQLRQRLSVLLTRDNMAMLGSRTPTLPPATIDGDVGGGEEDEYMQL